MATPDATAADDADLPILLIQMPRVLWTSARRHLKVLETTDLLAQPSRKECGIGVSACGRIGERGGSRQSVSSIRPVTPIRRYADTPAR
jgi:hypothetical protein